MKTQWMLQITTANLPENQESKQTCLRGTCTLSNSKKLHDKSTQQKHPEQHGKNIYSRTLCILTHLDTKKTAKARYSKCGIYRLKSDNYYFSDNGIPNLIFLGNKLLWSSQSRNSSSSHKGTPSTEYAGASLGLADRARWRQPHRSCQTRHLQTSPGLLAKTSIHKVSTSSIREPVIHCLNHGCRLILEKLIVTANLRFFFPI